jgi:hypothetical protein
MSVAAGGAHESIAKRTARPTSSTSLADVSVETFPYATKLIGRYPSSLGKLSLIDAVLAGIFEQELQAIGVGIVQRQPGVVPLLCQATWGGISGFFYPLTTLQPISQISAEDS